MTSREEVIRTLTVHLEEIVAFLKAGEQLSLAIEAERHFRKLLVLSCASFFESEVTRCLEEFADGSGDVRLANLVKSKAIKRQYHTLFDWERANVNKFLAHFGDDFKREVGKKLSGAAELDEGARAFLAIGQERNKLVHGNLAVGEVEKSLAEIMDLFGKAGKFISLLWSEFVPPVKQGEAGALAVEEAPPASTAASVVASAPVAAESPMPEGVERDAVMATAAPGDPSGEAESSVQGPPTPGDWDPEGGSDGEPPASAEAGGGAVADK